MPLAELDIEFLRDLATTKSGRMVSKNQIHLFEPKLQLVAYESGLGSVTELVSELRKGSTQIACDRVADAMTINETYFFRDKHPFEALRSAILPKLIEARTRQLTIWCAACSSGQEPYSVAMTIREYFPELANWDLKIIATDISEDVLVKARCGEFTQLEVDRGLPNRLLMQHFERNGTAWKLKDSIRSMIEFQKRDLSKPWPDVPKCDVVFLRNVLVYFKPFTKELILNRLRSTIEEDGYLLLGGGESLMNLNAPFERETVGGTVAYKPAKL